MAAAIALTITSPTPSFANPLGANIVAGRAEVQGEGTGNVTITQSTDRAVIDWKSFSVNAGESVVFLQPNKTSVTANRVTGMDPSQIMGSITATGTVVLINRNGIVFGKDSTVDAAGLIATTHNLDDTSFMRGDNILRFDDGGNPDAAIVVNGRISLREAGLGAFVAPHVRNNGIIEANLGRVALGASNGFSVDLYGDGLISFAPGDAMGASVRDSNGNAVKALIENAGTISAQGGKILLTAAAARDVINASVNIAGVVQAESVSKQMGSIAVQASGAIATEAGSLLSTSGEGGGNIAITAGAVSLGGVLDASATERKSSGGVITVNAEGLLSLAGTNRATATRGRGGHISYNAARIMENTDGLTDVRGLSDGGVITSIARGVYSTSGTYLADGIYGQGGRIDLGGHTISLLSSKISASGRSQGGLVRVGGPFQGGKNFEGTASVYGTFIERWGPLPELVRADTLFVNDATMIDVSSVRGAGGTAIIWSDSLTTFLGGIDALGLRPGSVEISSAGTLRHISLDAVRVGAGGTLLLDPQNIIIGTADDGIQWSYSAILRSVNFNLPRGLGSSDAFGAGVALNAAGDRLAVSALGDDGLNGSATDSGAVYLFSFSDTSFSVVCCKGSSVTAIPVPKTSMWGWTPVTLLVHRLHSTLQAIDSRSGQAAMMVRATASRTAVRSICLALPIQTLRAAHYRRPSVRAIRVAKMSICHH